MLYLLIVLFAVFIYNHNFSHTRQNAIVYTLYCPDSFRLLTKYGVHKRALRVPPTSPLLLRSSVSLQHIQTQIGSSQWKLCHSSLCWHFWEMHAMPWKSALRQKAWKLILILVFSFFHIHCTLSSRPLWGKAASHCSALSLQFLIVQSANKFLLALPFQLGIAAFEYHRKISAFRLLEQWSFGKWTHQSLALLQMFKFRWNFVSVLLHFVQFFSSPKVKSKF